MNAIVYYSNTRQSKHIAEYLSTKLDYPLLDITKIENYTFDNLVLVFPVYCQSIPDYVKAFLSRLCVDSLALLATYGRMCYGNVLWEIQKKYNHNIIAGAYIPTKHSYLEEKNFENLEGLDAIIEKIKKPSAVEFPKEYKNPFADFFKKSRSMLGVKIIKGTDCDECGACDKLCINNAIKNGITNSKCIRCLKCVTECPKKALSIKNRLPLRLYLSKKKLEKLVIYV